jgi:hypothetical protein
MIDLHLINMALASLGIGAGAVVLIAIAVAAIAALSQHVTALRHGTPVIPIPSRVQATPADSGLARRAA